MKLLRIKNNASYSLIFFASFLLFTAISFLTSFAVEPAVVNPISNQNEQIGIVSRRIKLAENNMIVAALCNYMGVVFSVLKIVSVFVIIITSIGFGLGKISWGICIGISCAIAIIFGAEKILVIFVGPKGMYACECRPGTKSYGDNCKTKSQ